MSLPDESGWPERIYGTWPQACRDIVEMAENDARLLAAEYQAWRGDSDHDDWEEQLDHARIRLLQALQIRALAAQSAPERNDQCQTS